MILVEELQERYRSEAGEYPDPDGLAAAIRALADHVIHERCQNESERRIYDRIRRVAVELATLRAGVVLVAIPGEQWHEGDGPCLWWRFPINEPPWSGDPRDDDWPGYHTHFTRIACPVLPSPQGENPSIITPQP